MLIAGAIPFALLLTSCAASNSASVSEPAFTPLPATTTEQASENSESESSSASSSSAETTPAQRSTTSTTKQDCASLPNDPKTMYPSGSAPGRMPNVDGTDFNYWIADIDNHYDPCAKLSWIVFRGSLGDERGPAGTAASINDGVAFYVNGTPDGEMRIFTSVDGISQTGDDTVTLSWGERTRSTAEGITAHYSVTLKAESGSVVPVSGDVAEFNELWYSSYGAYLLGSYD